jgi:hypothetical protein
VNKKTARWRSDCKRVGKSYDLKPNKNSMDHFREIYAIKRGKIKEK